MHGQHALERGIRGAGARRFVGMRHQAVDSADSLRCVMDNGLRHTTSRLFDAFWAAGISSPLEIMEQISHLLYLRELDAVQEHWERETVRQEPPQRQPVFTQDEQYLRWSQLIRLTPQRMYTSMTDEVFPWLRRHTFAGVGYSQLVTNARFTIPTPSLLARVVGLLEEALSAGDAIASALYEELLARVATAGPYGAFRTPPHLAALMAAMAEPGADDEVCDPTCGMGGLLAAAAQFVHRSRPDIAQHSAAEVSGRIQGFDFDMTMLRLSSMRLALQGYEGTDLRYRDNLAEGAGAERERYSVVLANPPFAGSVDYEAVADELLAMVRTKKAELLHLAVVLQLLKPKGRAAVIVPAGLLFSTTSAHRTSAPAGGRAWAGGCGAAAWRHLQAVCGCIDGDPVLHQGRRTGRQRVVLRPHGGRLQPGRPA